MLNAKSCCPLRLFSKIISVLYFKILYDTDYHRLDYFLYKKTNRIIFYSPHHSFNPSYTHPSKSTLGQVPSHGYGSEQNKIAAFMHLMFNATMNKLENQFIKSFLVVISNNEN